MEKSDTYSVKLWMYQKREAMTERKTDTNTLPATWNETRKRKITPKSMYVRSFIHSFVHSIKNNKFVTFLSLNKNDLLVFLPWVSFLFSVQLTFFFLLAAPMYKCTYYNIFLCVAFFCSIYFFVFLFGHIFSVGSYFLVVDFYTQEIALNCRKLAGFFYRCLAPTATTFIYIYLSFSLFILNASAFCRYCIYFR